MGLDIILSTLNGLILATWFFVSLKRRRIYSVVPGALLVFHTAAGMRIDAASQEFGIATVLYGQVLLLIANLLLAVTCTLLDPYLVPRGRLQDLGHWLRASSASKNRYFAVMAVLLVVVVALYLRGGVQRIAIGWEEAREDQSSVESIAIFISFIVFPSAWVAFRSRMYAVGAILAVLSLAIFQVMGSRAVLLTIVMIAYAELLLSGLSSQKKLATMLVLAVLGLGLHTASRLTRGVGLVGLVELARSLDFSDVIQSDAIDLTGGEGNIYRYYYYVVQKSYDHYPYGTWPTARRLALLYVPTRWAPDVKPTDITYTLYADAYYDGVFDEDPYLEKIGKLLEGGQTGSIHPSLWGEAYANGGLVAILLVPVFLGVILVVVERYLRRLTPVGVLFMVPVTMVGYLMVARGNSVIGFGYLAYVFPIVIATAWFGGLRLFHKRMVGTKGPTVQMPAPNAVVEDARPIAP